MPSPSPNPAAPVLIGHSPAIEKLRSTVEKLGRSATPVLLLGETGTGKEVVARAIHRANPGGPFVAVDCSLPGALLQTELFGHTRGAFTGAVASKTGLLAAAEGGTVFLDEIGEFPLEIQVKLLRVLQEKEIRPLGALISRIAHFRIIAATNRDLAREVECGAFRRDLYYRLNVVTLRLPPLRDRREDIPELAAHFLARHPGGHQLSGELVAALLHYDWPGNVRELENCIERMVAMTGGPLLQPQDLPSALAGALWAASETSAVSRPPAPAGSPRPQRLEEVERQAIMEALVYTHGDRSRAAELLGIGRTTLYRRIKQYGL